MPNTQLGLTAGGVKVHEDVVIETAVTLRHAPGARDKVERLRARGLGIGDYNMLIAQVWLEYDGLPEVFDEMSRTIQGALGDLKRRDLFLEFVRRATSAESIARARRTPSHTSAKSAAGGAHEAA